MKDDTLLCIVFTNTQNHNVCLSPLKGRLIDASRFLPLPPAIEAKTYRHSHHIMSINAWLGGIGTLAYQVHSFDGIVVSLFSDIILISEILLRPLDDMITSYVFPFLEDIP